MANTALAQVDQASPEALVSISGPMIVGQVEIKDFLYPHPRSLTARNTECTRKAQCLLHSAAHPSTNTTIARGSLVVQGFSSCVKSRRPRVPP